MRSQRVCSINIEVGFSFFEVNKSNVWTFVIFGEFTDKIVTLIANRKY